MVKLTRNFWGKCLLSILSSWAPFVSVSVLFRFADLDSPYNELQYVAPSCSPCYRCLCKIQKGMCWSALRCVAVCCSVLRRCVAACRSPCFRCFRKFGQGCVAVWCTAMQRVAVWCRPHNSLLEGSCRQTFLSGKTSDLTKVNLLLNLLWKLFLELIFDDFHIYIHTYTRTYTSTPCEWRQEQEPSEPHTVGILKRQRYQMCCCSVLQCVADTQQHRAAKFSMHNDCGTDFWE